MGSADAANADSLNAPRPAAPTPRRQAPIVGIDLGTTYSLVAVAAWPDPAAPARIIPDAHGRVLCPSAVRFIAPDQPPLVGWDALEPPPSGAHATLITSAKRLMGRTAADVAAADRFRAYRVVAGPAGAARIALDPDAPHADHGLSPRLIAPEEVAAHILRHLRRQASDALGVDITRAVITVPAYFDDAQRQATRTAATLAGLEPVRILAEPTAAALAYGLGITASGIRAAREASSGRCVVVFDLGGGTFDVSLLRLAPTHAVPAGVDTANAENPERAGADPHTARPPHTHHAADAFEVLATAGDTHLGGDDFDHAIVDWLLSEHAVTIGLPAPTTSPHPPHPPHPPHRAPAALRAELKAAAERAKIALSEHDRAVITLPSRPGVEIDLTRDRFESLIAPLVDRAVAIARRTLREARRRLDQEPIAAVVLVGGSTRVPLIRRRVAEAFELEPYTALDPDQVVALGAAVQGAVLGINAGAPRGWVGDAMLLDVVPLSLGIETAHGAFSRIIMRNTPVPARASEMFSTSVDGQTSIKIHVLQGEREMAADCRSLAVFHLRGIPPMPAGIPQLRVEFALDANAILSVSAVELRSGRRAQVQVIPNHGLTLDEVARIEADAFAHAREDMTRHRLADLLANSRLDLHWIARQRERHADALTDQQRRDLDTAAERLRDLADRAERDWRSVDPDEFHRAKETLDRASMRLHEVAITSALRDTPPAPPAPGT
jgi:molecular chaperone DnaK (HSP70)